VSPPPAALPDTCAECVFFRKGEKVWGTCFRRAPSPGTDAQAQEFEVVHWPGVRPNQRCGLGVKIGNSKGPNIVPCGRCVHWWQPERRPISPAYRSGLPREWWEGSGYCTRNAPGPSTETGRRTFWRVTHAAQGCGDGLDASTV
jgi:hypothetical protein